MLTLLAASAQGQRLETWTDGADTSLTTVIYNTGGTEWNRAFNYDAMIYVDITGTESATITIDVKPFGQATYYPVKSWTGISADRYIVYSGYSLGGTIRVSALSTNTGSVAITSWVTQVAADNVGRVLETWGDGPDTTATTAINLAGGGSLNKPYYYDLAVSVDVVSDTATIYLDVLPFGSATWIPFDTTATILTDTKYFFQGYFQGGKIRARVQSDGTGSSAATVWAMYAKKED